MKLRQPGDCPQNSLDHLHSLQTMLNEAVSCNDLTTVSSTAPASGGRPDQSRVYSGGSERPVPDRQSRPALRLMHCLQLLPREHARARHDAMAASLSFAVPQVMTLVTLTGCERTKPIPRTVPAPVKQGQASSRFRYVAGRAHNFSSDDLGWILSSDERSVQAQGA